MVEIEIAGKKHQCEKDSFGLLRIDGMLLDEFTETLTPEELSYASKVGLSVAKNDPDHFRDIGERLEQDPDKVEKLIKWAGGK